MRLRVACICRCGAGASSCVLMVALPTVGNEGRKFKTYYWPARLATQTEATAWKNEKAGFTKVGQRPATQAARQSTGQGH